MDASVLRFRTRLPVSRTNALLALEVAYTDPLHRINMAAMMLELGGDVKNLEQRIRSSTTTSTNNGETA